MKFASPYPSESQLQMNQSLDLMASDGLIASSLITSSPLATGQLLNQSGDHQPTQLYLSETYQKHIERLVELSYPFRTVMVIIYLVTAIIAFIANFFALLILIYGPRKSSQLNHFLSNLGLSDIIFAIFNIPFTYITLIYNTWWLPEFLCPLSSFVQVLAPTVAFYTLIAIGIGRYFVIVTGQETLFLTRSSYTKVVITAIWALACILASPILFAMKITPVIYQNTTYVECGEDWSLMESTLHIHSFGTKYTILVFVVTFILPTVALCYLYGHIGLIVYKHQLPGGNDSIISNHNLTQTKVKVVKMLLILVISFIVCWSPCQIFYLLLWIFEDIRQDTASTGQDDGSSSYYSIFYYSIYFTFHWLSCSHTIMNPFIYCFFSNSFQKSDLIDILLCNVNSPSKRRQSVTTNQVTNQAVTHRKSPRPTESIISCSVAGHEKSYPV